MCYSPVRHSLHACAQRTFDLHVLGTPPAFILSQDQTRHPMLYLILPKEHGMPWCVLQSRPSCSIIQKTLGCSQMYVVMHSSPVKFTRKKWDNVSQLTGTVLETVFCVLSNAMLDRVSCCTKVCIGVTVQAPYTLLSTLQLLR